MLKLDRTHRQVSLADSQRWLQIKPSVDLKFHVTLLVHGIVPAMGLTDLVADPICLDRVALELGVQCEASGPGVLQMENTGEDIEIQYRSDPRDTPHVGHVNLAEFQQLIIQANKDLESMRTKAAS